MPLAYDFAVLHDYTAERAAIAIVYAFARLGDCDFHVFVFGVICRFGNLAVGVYQSAKADRRYHARQCERCCL